MTTALDLSNLRPGFHDPVKEGQAAFRVILDAMSNPGSLKSLSLAAQVPEDVGSAAGAVLLTLADMDTPVWLKPPLAGGDLSIWLRFHCNCPLTLDPSAAAFALAKAAEALPDLNQFNLGDAKYPDRATTLILVLPALTGGETVRLQGPGIETQAEIAPCGLPSDFWSVRTEVNSKFQFGIDLMLCAGDEIICLPRTTRTLEQGS
jgi:alpha-D-ribose 1-methylphosphonate 5-triphosphate synthase subunit PhnH